MIRSAFFLVLLCGSCVLADGAVCKAPPGFVVELVAAEPQIRFPMFACFDDRGRLYVTESSGLDLYAEISAGTRKCQVRRLEDRDRDGKYEIAEVFADKLVFPMGLAWRDGKLYVADPPDLVTLEDTNSDGRAQKRTVILSGFGAKDNGSLHGLIFGPDGWLYMTLGQPDGYRFELPGGRVLEGRSGALIRCRPDGSQPEVLSRGFENLVEVIFMPSGEIIGTDNWYQKPHAGIRDALVHLVPGGLYPYQPDSHTKFPITGDPLPPLTLFPAVALSGLVRYEGENFPSEWRGNLFSAQHNTRKIGRHVLRRHGSTFTSEDSDFLSSDDPDFHPSDVLEAPDGSLLILDTGSWYTQHCPTGRIRKSPATGGIYRVRWKGDHQQPKKREARSLWRVAEDTNELRRALMASDVDHACAAARILGELRLRALAPNLISLLGVSNPPVQLAAAEALARCGDSSAIPALVQTLAGAPDAFLEHAAVYALHHLADEQTLLRLLSHASARVQKGALLLLAQPPRSPNALRPETVFARLESEDAALRKVALQLVQSRSDWASEALRVAQQWLNQQHPPGGLRALLRAFFGTTDFQNLVRNALTEGPSDRRGFVLEAIAAVPAPKDSGSWINVLTSALGDRTPEVRLWAVRVAGNWNLKGLDPALQELSNDSSQPEAVRAAALRATVGRLPTPSASAFEFILAQLRQESLTAGELLRRMHLSDTQLLAALRVAKGSAVIPAASLLVAFRQSTSREATEKLLEEIAGLPPLGWNEQEFSRFVQCLPAEFRTRADNLRKHFEPERESQQARLAKFEPLLRGGDAARGRAVFASSKVACATCHAVGSQGGKVGPDLTRVGAIRSGRDILESILFPTSTLAQGYEPFILETRDGDEYSGIVVEGDEHRVVLGLPSGAEISLARARLKQLRRASLSIMPEGLETAMSEREFRDLLAYLQQLK